MNILFLATQAAAGSANNITNNIMMIALLIFAGAFMYFGAIRPQKKQQQKRMEMMGKLQKGDKVVLVDGLHAKIDSINEQDKTVVVDADGIYLTFSRMAVREVLEPASSASDQASASEEKTEEAESAPESTETKENK